MASVASMLTEDYKASLRKIISAAVEESVRASCAALVHESADETARRRTRGFGEAGRRRIELAEDRARRDPVWAEKMARRHAAFSDVPPSTASPATTATDWVATAVLELDPSMSMPVTELATSASPAPPSVLTACVERAGKLAAQPPTTCSTNFPGRAAASAVSTISHTAASTTYTATVAVIPEPATPIISDMGHDIVVVNLANITEEEDPGAVGMALRSESTSDNLPPEGLPTRPREQVRSKAGASAEDNATYKLLNNEIKWQRWPPPLHVWVPHRRQVPRPCPWPSFECNLHSYGKFMRSMGSVQDLHGDARAMVNLHFGQRISGIHTDSVSVLFKLLATCSGLGCGTTHSVCLLPWDPGEKPVVLRDSVLSRDITCDACVKKLNADSSGNHDHHQELGYAHTQNYFYWPIQVLCSSQNVIGKCSFKGIYGEFLGYQFDSASYSQVPIQNSLVEFFCDVQSNIQPLYPEVSAYLSLTTSLEAYHCAPATLGLVLPYGFVSLPWKNAWSSLFNNWRANWSSCKFRPYILWSQNAALLPIAFGSTTLEGPMEQWDPGIPRFFHMCIQHCLVSCHLISIAVTKVRPYIALFQHGFRFSTTDHTLVEGNEFKYFVITLRQVVWDLYMLQATGSVLAVISPSLQDYLLQSFDTGNGCFGGSSYFSFEVLAIGNHKLMANIFDDVDLPSRVQDVQLPLILVRSSEHTFSEYFLQLVSKVLVSKELKLPWDPGRYNSANYHYRALLSLYLMDFSCLRRQYPNCTMLIMEGVTQSECFLWEFAWSLHSRCCAGMASTIPFQLIAYIAMWSSRILEFCQGKLSWDPGIWVLVCFFGFFTQAEVKGRRNAAAPAYYRDYCLDHAYYFYKVCADQGCYVDVFRDLAHISHDYYIGVFLEQVRVVGYLNLIKICLDYGIHRNLNDVIKHHVPWDPGGSTWYRLEVKPTFKEGGMLATNPPGLLLPGLGLGPLGLDCTEALGGSDYIYTGSVYEERGLD